MLGRRPGVIVACIAAISGHAGCGAAPVDERPVAPCPEAMTTCDDAACRFEVYRACNVCDETDGPYDQCLEPVGDVFSWRATELVGWRPEDRGTAHEGQVLPKPLLPYMRLLREAYRADPQRYAGHLDDMIEHLLADTTRRGRVNAWENPYRITGAIEQSEYGAYFASVAELHASLGDDARAGEAITLGLDAIAALAAPVGPETGGVRAAPTQTCGQTASRKRPCYWFHSRGRGVAHGPEPQMVLHHQLRAVRDALFVYLAVRDLSPLVSDARAEEAALIDSAVGGLYQLAFSPGNDADRPWSPPNMLDMRRWTKPPVGESYHWSHFSFARDWDPVAGAGGAGVGADIASSCQYHLDVLELSAVIGRLLQGNRGQLADEADGWRLFEAMEALLAFDARDLFGAPGSPFALYQFFLTAMHPGSMQAEGCTRALSGDAIEFYAEAFELDLACPIDR